MYLYRVKGDLSQLYLKAADVLWEQLAGVLTDFQILSAISW